MLIISKHSYCLAGWHEQHTHKLMLAHHFGCKCALDLLNAKVSLDQCMGTQAPQHDTCVTGQHMGSVSSNFSCKTTGRALDTVGAGAGAAFVKPASGKGCAELGVGRAGRFAAAAFVMPGKRCWLVCIAKRQYQLGTINIA